MATSLELRDAAGVSLKLAAAIPNGLNDLDL